MDGIAKARAVAERYCTAWRQDDQAGIVDRCSDDSGLQSFGSPHQRCFSGIEP